jgi:hypothetical protein
MIKHLTKPGPATSSRKRWMLSLASWQVMVIPIHFGVGFEFWNGMDMFLVSMDYTCVNLGKQVWLSYV